MSVIKSIKMKTYSSALACMNNANEEKTNYNRMLRLLELNYDCCVSVCMCCILY